MKCFYHETAEAVASCQSCGKFLCKECASKHNPCLCEECYANIVLTEQQQKAQQKRDALIDTKAEFITAVIKGVICALAVTLLFNYVIDPGTKMPFIVSAMFFFIPYGWAVMTYLEQYLPAMFVSVLLLLFYLPFKIGLSMAIGIPAFFYQVIKFIVKMAKNKRAE